MYIAIHIRSDIIFAIKRFNQYFSNLTIHHKQTLIILSRYVCFTINFDIIYKMKLNVNENSNNNENFKFKTFSDFDYAADKFNKKSIFQYIYMFVKRLITWINHKQKSVVISIIKVKYIILLIWAKKRLWLTQLLKNMKYIKYFEIELN